MHIERLLDAPIITGSLHPTIGTNIQGPSLIKVPDWLPNPLAQYYLYFADHKGAYIRLAYADSLSGPWKIHAPGTLQLRQSCFPTEPLSGSDKQIAAVKAYAQKVKLPHDIMQEVTTPHIASPDVHVDDEARQLVMYFHGLESFANQVSRVAVSEDGIHFTARPEVLGKTYMRVFTYQGVYYGLSMPGTLYRSKTGLTDFEQGPTLFTPDMRHSAVRLKDDCLQVFWTRVGDSPERILLSSIDLSANWLNWKAVGEQEIMRPERSWEGADAPLQPSIRSVAYGHLNQLRDPAIYEEQGRCYLLYAVAGESGIAIAEIFDD